jgi:DNA-binding beta-propeller fold protein YncE
MSIERTLAGMAAGLFMLGSAHGETLRLVQTIPLPNVEGRIDHMAVDVAGQRLFIAALGNNSVEVVDLRAGKRTQSLTGFREPQGVAWIPGHDQLLVASGGDDVCHVLDGKSFAATAIAGKIEDADNARYDAGAHRVYIGCGNGTLRVLNTTNWSVAGEIALPAHPESFQLQTHGPLIFVNVPGAHSVEVIDREQKRVVSSWPLKSAGGNFPMALDEEHRRLIIGCRKPTVLVVLDTDSGQEITSVEIDGDADDIFCDAKRNRIYVSCGAGFLDVLDAGSFKMLQRIPTGGGARTSLFVPELNRLYLAVPHRGNQQAEVRVYETTGD